jgi:predicted CopG family antitoxin
MPGRGTRMRAVRIPDELWQAALTEAKRRGESLSDVIRRALSEYITPSPPEQE